MTVLEVFSRNHRIPSGAAPHDIADLERAIGRQLPDDYKGYLASCDGGTHEVGSEYIELWPTREIPTLNSGYAIQRWLPELVGIGSDGGGKCYALNYGADSQEPSLVRVPFRVLSANAVVTLGESFRVGLENLRARS